MKTQNQDAHPGMSRRQWLRDTGTMTGGLLAAGLTSPFVLHQNAAAQTPPAAPGSTETFIPVRAITKGPKFHWFGYYDKLQFDPSCRFALGMEVDFEHRSPTADDVIKIGMIDMQDGDRWTDLGESRAWCWQQGCMLQWRPGSASEILWNDRQKGRFVCHILDVKTGSKRTVDHPIYCLSPDGKTAMTVDFERIQDVRAGYGYCGIPDRNRDNLSPDDAGIYRLDLESGKKELIISVEQIVKLGTIPNPDPYAKHYFNHLLFSPDGSRFIFLHRWRYPDGTRKTRMLTATPEGKDIAIVDDNGITSHFVWQDIRYILAESIQSHPKMTLYLFEDRTRNVSPLNPEVFDRAEHFNYLPHSDWLINDTYPRKNDRFQRVFLYHLKTKKVVPLGNFYSPPDYTGEWRCDLHTRVSPDGKSAIIDSPHGGEGRQLYLLDLNKAIEKA